MGQTDLFGDQRRQSDAVFSPCRTWRYRLDRVVSSSGPVYAYFGVNGSTADEDDPDHTVSKWTGFTRIAGGSRFIVGNPFAFCATDVRELRSAPDPIGPDNELHLGQIIEEADILVPCWGRRSKVPARLRPEIAKLLDRILAARKPVLHFGLNNCGSPKHVLTLGYDTPLTPWDGRS